jgi:hypothetical protein
VLEDRSGAGSQVPASNRCKLLSSVRWPIACAMQHGLLLWVKRRGPGRDRAFDGSPETFPAGHRTKGVMGLCSAKHSLRAVRATSAAQRGLREPRQYGAQRAMERR